MVEPQEVDKSIQSVVLLRDKKAEFVHIAIAIRQPNSLWSVFEYAKYGDEKHPTQEPGSKIK